MNIFKRIHLFLLFHQRKYEKVLSLTLGKSNPKEDFFDPLLIRYEAYCSFYTKNYHHSQLSLESLKERNKLNSKDCTFLAYLYARHNEIDNAISTWCLSLEKNKSNRIAHEALNHLRKSGSNFISLKMIFLIQ